MSRPVGDWIGFTSCSRESSSWFTLRASALPKKYGWGVHFDKNGNAALYGRESQEYRKLSSAEKQNRGCDDEQSRPFRLTAC